MTKTLKIKWGLWSNQPLDSTFSVNYKYKRNNGAAKTSLKTWAKWLNIFYCRNKFSRNLLCSVKVLCSRLYSVECPRIFQLTCKHDWSSNNCTMTIQQLDSGYPTTGQLSLWTTWLDNKLSVSHVSQPGCTTESSHSLVIFHCPIQDKPHFKPT